MRSYRIEYISEDKVPLLKEFYGNSDRRGRFILERPEKYIRREAKRHNGVVAFNQDDAVVAAAIGYMVKDGAEIEFQRSTKELGRVVEFGSMLRVDNEKRLKSDPDIDKGIWGFALTGCWELGLLKNAIPADIVTLGSCNHPRTKNLTEFICQWPLKFQFVNPSDEFLREDSKLVNGADLSNTSHYRAYTPSLVPISEILLDVAREGVIRDVRAPSAIGYNGATEVRLDISALGIDHLLEAIVQYGPSYFEEMRRRMRPGEEVTIGYAEVGRYFRSQAKALAERSIPEAYRNGIKARTYATQHL